jgi:hypothetical protein
MTCAKKQVTCTLKLTNGWVVIGNNTCDNPQETCPRLPDEGYDKCHTICQQEGHAEDIAVRIAQRSFPDHLRGAHAVITHHRVCDGCKAILDAHGITYETTESTT